MKKLYILIAIGIIIISVVGWIVFSDRSPENLSEKETEILKQEDNIQEKVILIIDYSEGDPQTFNIEYREKLTAFDLLKAKAEELGFALRTKTYDIGIFIEAIGKKENGQDGKYWMYYINGEMPMVSADKKELKAGDKVEFKFEKSPF